VFYLLIYEVDDRKTRGSFQTFLIKPTHMKKLFVVAAAALLLIVPAQAGKKKGGANNAKAQQEAKEKAAKHAENDKKREAVNGLLKEKDKNDDGTLSKDEYMAGEADAAAAGAKWDQFNKNGDRQLSRKEIEEMLGL